MVKTCGAWRSTHRDVLQVRQQLVGGRARQHERPPGDPEADAQRGLVRTVPADVADHRVDRAVLRLHGVEEVAAEQRAPAAGAVVGGERERRVGHERGRQQAALQAGVLARLELGDRELLLRQLGPAALDGVAQGAREQRPARRALDQVVLGAGGDGLHPAALVGEPGEHQHRELRRQRPQLAQPAQALGVGQVEVEQHAVEGGEPRGGRLGQRAGAVHLDVRAREAELLLDEQGVAVVVLHEQDAHALAHAGGHRDVGGAVHRRSARTVAGAPPPSPPVP